MNPNAKSMIFCQNGTCGRAATIKVFPPRMSYGAARYLVETQLGGTLVDNNDPKF